MKRYGNLYPRIYDMANIAIAHDNARRGKAHYREVKKINANPGKYFRRIHTMLKTKTFINSPYSVFIKTGVKKTRTIHKLPYFPDRIIHHCIVQVMEPIWIPWLTKDTLACLRGRGIHRGVTRIRDALRFDPRNTRYCLKMDVARYYPTIDHAVLATILARKIKDPDVMWLLERIIMSTDRGIPIGNYLSQYFGNLYLTPMDHWIKESLKCKHYFRYCDDMVILGSDKGLLHEVRRRVGAYLQDKLRLTLKLDWQVFPVAARGIDFLGYRFFPGYTLLRKSTAAAFKRKMRDVRTKRFHKNNRTSTVSMVMSYHGWLKHANCLNLWHRHIDKRLADIVAAECRRNGIRNPMERSFV